MDEGDDHSDDDDDDDELEGELSDEGDPLALLKNGVLSPHTDPLAHGRCRGLLI